MSMIWKVTSAVIVAMVLAIVALISLGNGFCETTVYNTQASPEGKYKVVHEMVNCGATTNFGTTVLLYKTSFPFFPSRILGLDGDYTDKEILINWEAPSKLRVNYEGRATDIRQIAFHAKGVEVEVYEKGNKLNSQRIEDVEKEIVKEQATYKIVLPEGSRWIEVSP